MSPTSTAARSVCGETGPPEDRHTEQWDRPFLEHGHRHPPRRSPPLSVKVGSWAALLHPASQFPCPPAGERARPGVPPLSGRDRSPTTGIHRRHRACGGGIPGHPVPTVIRPDGTRTDQGDQDIRGERSEHRGGGPQSVPARRPPAAPTAPPPPLGGGRARAAGPGDRAEEPTELRSIGGAIATLATVPFQALPTCSARRRALMTLGTEVAVDGDDPSGT